MTHSVPDCFYRISIKALILNQARDKFAITLEDNGWWELPGGGLDHGENPEECLKRELMEEAGLVLTSIAHAPSYYIFRKTSAGLPALNLVFEVTVKDFNYTISSECQELRFVSPEEVTGLQVYSAITELAHKFNSHSSKAK